MKRALVVIDVQESFRTLPSWEEIGDPRIAEPVNRLVQLARSAGDLVVWVLHSQPGDGGPFDPASGHVRLLAELERPAADEPVLHKTAHNAFTTTNLQHLLTRAGVREVWLCGLRTEQCVETTTRLASDLGYQAVLVTDATTTSPLGGLDVRELTERTEVALRDRFARIATVAELAAERESSPV
ncbi:cysteine hydrolase family protein [Streptomyces sp. NPDC057702]|uniref:cysteine hydrolase family protein n=1 Tax=unclassified Streptomyces TaxID=2593676 RepID=UPI0036A03D62